MASSPSPIIGAMSTVPQRAASRREVTDTKLSGTSGPERQYCGSAFADVFLTGQSVRA